MLGRLTLWIITEETMTMNIPIEDLPLIDFSDVIDPTADRTPLIHPGEILQGDFLKPLGLSQYALAKAIGVSPRRINEIVKGQRGITTDTALRLATFFGTDPQSWLNLQNHYDMGQARDAMTDILARIPRYERLAA
jgi:addiction module HigA family antidote